MKIILTGKTSGQAVLNQFLMSEIIKRGWDCMYIGPRSGSANTIVKEQGPERYAGYAAISTGNLSPHFSLSNLVECGRIVLGVIQACVILKKEKASLIFSWGGDSSIPVVIAAGILKIPVVSRKPGCPSSRDDLIVRPELLTQPRISLRGIGSKPTLLVMGGGFHDNRMNNIIWNHFEAFTKQFQVIHLCGSGNYRSDFPSGKNYLQYEFVENIGLLYKEADVVVTCGGSGTLSECLALGKRIVCIPVARDNNDGRQAQNAAVYCTHGNAVTVREEEMNADILFDAVERVQRLSFNRSMILTAELLKKNCGSLLAELEKSAWKSVPTKRRHLRNRHLLQKRPAELYRI